MEWVFVVLVIWVLVEVLRVILSALGDFFSWLKTYSANNDNSNHSSLDDTTALDLTKTFKTGVLLDKEPEETQLQKQEVHHFHHVRVTHDYSTDNRSSETSKDHSERVWNRLGYEVMPGETYAYKFYGNKIFEPHQVKKMGGYRNRITGTGLSKNQLKVKTLGLALIEKTGSKRTAKDILVDEYGFAENTAKYATGYYDY